MRSQTYIARKHEYALVAYVIGEQRRQRKGR